MSAAQRAALASLALVLCGCPVIQELRSSQQEPTPSGPEALDPERKHARLRATVGCRDALAEALRTNFDEYSRQVKRDGTLRRKRQGVYIHAIPRAAFRRCDTIIGRPAPSEEELGELHLATVRLYETAQGYAESTRDLERWLEARKGQDWSGLGEHHRKLVAAWELWTALDAEVSSKADELTTANDPEFLSALEEQGRELELRTWALMASARPLHGCLMAQQLPEVCAPLHEGFSTAWSEFAEAVGQRRTEAQRVFWMQTFEADAADYRDSVARVLGLSQAPNDDAVALLRNEYGALVLDANTLDFAFAVP